MDRAPNYCNNFDTHLDKVLYDTTTQSNGQGFNGPAKSPDSVVNNNIHDIDLSFLDDCENEMTDPDLGTCQTLQAHEVPCNQQPVAPLLTERQVELRNDRKHEFQDLIKFPYDSESFGGDGGERSLPPPVTAQYNDVGHNPLSEENITLEDTSTVGGFAPTQDQREDRFPGTPSGGEDEQGQSSASVVPEWIDRTLLNQHKFNEILVQGDIPSSQIRDSVFSQNNLPHGGLQGRGLLSGQAAEDQVFPPMVEASLYVHTPDNGRNTPGIFGVVPQQMSLEASPVSPSIPNRRDAKKRNATEWTIGPPKKARACFTAPQGERQLLRSKIAEDLKEMEESKKKEFRKKEAERAKKNRKDEKFKINSCQEDIAQMLNYKEFLEAKLEQARPTCMDCICGFLCDLHTHTFGR